MSGVVSLSARRAERDATEELWLSKHDLGRALGFSTRSVDRWVAAVSTLWRPVRHAAGLPEITLHHLRHYCATRLLEAGLEAWEVAVQLGHRDGGALVMSTYGHPSERRALDRVAAALGETTAGVTAAAAGSAGRTG